jgi:hypothetical protein
VRGRGEFKQEVLHQDLQVTRGIHLFFFSRREEIPRDQQPTAFLPAAGQLTPSTATIIPPRVAQPIHRFLSTQHAALIPPPHPRCGSIASQMCGAFSVVMHKVHCGLRRVQLCASKLREPSVVRRLVPTLEPIKRDLTGRGIKLSAVQYHAAGILAGSCRLAGRVCTSHRQRLIIL